MVRHFHRTREEQRLIHRQTASIHPSTKSPRQNKISKMVCTLRGRGKGQIEGRSASSYSTKRPETPE